MIPPGTVTARPRLCRHCASLSLEDRPRTYACALVAGGSTLLEAVESLEERIVPCVTAVCPKCDRVSLVSDGSTESMLCSIYMWQRLREWIDTAYAAPEAAEEDGASSSAMVHVVGGGERKKRVAEREDAGGDGMGRRAAAKVMLELGGDAAIKREDDYEEEDTGGSGTDDEEDGGDGDERGAGV